MVRVRVRVRAVLVSLTAALTSIMPERKFFGCSHPAVIVTDNDLKERTPLSSVFPESTLLLCQFHVLKSVWSWLCDSKNAVSASIHQEIYFAFKTCLYTHSVSDMEQKFGELLTSQHCIKNSKLHNYLSVVWASRSEWASCYRLGLPVRGSNTTNYVEVVFKVLKDCIFDRVLAYNGTQLLDFLVTRYEQYMVRRLLDFANGRYSKVLLKQMMPAASDVDFDDIVDDGEGCFTVPSVTKHDVMYTVDIAKGVCSCFAGSSGVLCKHMSAVMCKVDSSISVSSGLKVANKESRSLMFEVATGNRPSAEWLSPLKMTQCDAHAADDTSDRDSRQPVSDGSDNAVHSECSLSLATEDLPTDAWCFSAIEEFYGRVKQGVQENPAAFKPAIVKMHQNLKTFAASESGLLTTLHTMGKYTGLPIKRKLTAFSGRRHGGVMIGVQPTAIKRRKSCLSGRRKFCGGRPVQTVKRHSALAQHDYGPLAPPRKKKCVHNLEKCVHSNVGLGSSRHAKA